MSSIRNSIPSRSYRERPQPLSRTRSHPLLEKKRDYKLRAASHKQKQQKLKLLREKARDRNPDEFSFGMMSSSSSGKAKRRSVMNSGGLGGDEGGLDEKVRAEVEMGKGLRQETVRLLKTQDLGFLRTMRGKVRRERERLEKALCFRGGDRKGERVVEVRGLGTKREKRTAFVNTQEEQRDYGVEEDSSQEVNGAADGKGRGKRKITKQEQAQKEEEKRNRISRRKQQERQKAKLATLKTQDEELGKAEMELEMQRARMNGDLGGFNKNGVRFKVKGRKR